MQSLKIQEENSKISPKKVGMNMIKKSQPTKKVIQNQAIMMLANSKLEQEELIKDKKLEKALKNLQIQKNPIKEDLQMKNDVDQTDKDSLFYEDAQDDILELEDNQMFDIESESSQEHFPNNQLKYDSIYGQEEDLNIKQNEVDLSQCLKNHKISALLRAKMVDWMIEVFANYKQSSTDKTYFRAVILLDQFYKKSTRPLKESDVHLFGIASMFLATKQEDISHITLDDIVEKVGHNKFSEKRIREAEFEILRVLDMRTDSPTAFTFLCRYIYKTFSCNANSTIYDITQTSIYILKMCLHDVSFLDYQSHILAFSVLIISLKFYFNSLRSENCSQQQVSQLQKQEIAVIDQMFKLLPSNEHKTAGTCSAKIKELFLIFSKKYPDLKNLDKFCQ